jgi:hypothetical protein
MWLFSDDCGDCNAMQGNGLFRGTGCFREVPQWCLAFRNPGPLVGGYRGRFMNVSDIAGPVSLLGKRPR